MTYFSKENFIAFIDKKIDKNGLGYVIGSQLKDYINKQPTADVVEVVRCKDCKHSNDDGTICRYSIGRTVEPIHFCSYGERKDT